MKYHHRQNVRGSRQNDNNHKWKKRIYLDRSLDYLYQLCQFHYYNWVEDPASKIIKNDRHRLYQFEASVQSSSFPLFILSSSTLNIFIIWLKPPDSNPLISLCSAYPTLSYPSNNTPLILYYPTHPNLPHPSRSISLVLLYITRSTTPHSPTKLYTFSSTPPVPL